MGEIKPYQHRSDRPSRSYVRTRNRHCHLKSNRIAIVIVCLRLAIPSLMVKGHSGIISRAGRRAVGPHARPTTEILHLGLRAGPASEISVATNRSEGRRSSGKVVLETVVVCGAACVIVNRGGVERRCPRIGTAVGRNNAVVGGRLPVDRSHALVEFGRVGELPLAEDGPKDDNPADRSGNYDKYGCDHTLFRGCSFLLLRRRGVGLCGISENRLRICDGGLFLSRRGGGRIGSLRSNRCLGLSRCG